MASQDRLSPPPKRMRYAEVYSTVERGSPTRPFWFADGDIVLDVERHLFKMHRKRLQCSEIFSDMLAVPQPDVVDKVDDCPIVSLPDAAQDWLVALQWMYEPAAFNKMIHPIPFTLIPSALRIGTKYEIGALRKWAVIHLRARWPSDLEHMDTSSLPCAAEAIALARECDVPEIIPAAFYALSLQRWGYNAEGGRSHLILSPADMRRLVIGREHLHHFTARILQDPFMTRPDGPSFDSCVQCREPLQRYWRAKVVSDPHSPFECWLLRELYVMATCADELFEATLCVTCLTWHKDMAWARFDGLKSSIPDFFCL